MELFKSLPTEKVPVEKGCMLWSVKVFYCVQITIGLLHHIMYQLSTSPIFKKKRRSKSQYRNTYCTVLTKKWLSFNNSNVSHSVLHKVSLFLMRKVSS